MVLSFSHAIFCPALTPSRAFLSSSYVSLIAYELDLNLSCIEQAVMIPIGANVLVTLVTYLEREILRVCCQLKWL